MKGCLLFYSVSRVKDFGLIVVLPAYIVRQKRVGLYRMLVNHYFAFEIMDINHIVILGY